jgi:hypothetical protein
MRVETGGRTHRTCGFSGIGGFGLRIRLVEQFLLLPSLTIAAHRIRPVLPVALREWSAWRAAPSHIFAIFFR